MRRFIASTLLIGLAMTARALDAPELEVAPEGGFHPRGSDFRVTFQFADMQPSRTPMATGWSGAEGTAARLDLCCVKRPLGLGEMTIAAARLRMSNPTSRPFQTALAVVIAPQSAIPALAFDRHSFRIEGRVVLVADTPSRGAILADSLFAPRPLAPQNQAHVESAKGECRGEMIFDLTLQPGQTQTLGFLCPVKLPEGKEPDLDFYRALSVEELFAEAEKQKAGR